MNSNYVEGNSPSSTTSCSGNAILQQPQTYVHPWDLARRRLENTIQSGAESTQSPKLESLGQRRTDIDKSRAGDLAEQYVILLASWRGAEVFPNANCTGKTDLIIKFNDIIFEVDVKLARPATGANSWRGHTDQVKAPVYPVLVIPEGDIFEWKVKWVAKKYPTGLEDFWS